MPCTPQGFQALIRLLIKITVILCTPHVISLHSTQLRGGYCKLAVICRKQNSPSFVRSSTGRRVSKHPEQTDCVSLGLKTVWLAMFDRGQASQRQQSLSSSAQAHPHPLERCQNGVESPLIKKKNW